MMMNRVSDNNRGNAVILAIVVGALSLAGLMLVLRTVAQYSQQVGQAEAIATQAGQNGVTLFYLQKKFAFGDPNSPTAPDWYPEFYPTPSELASVPRIAPIQPVGQALPTSHVPLFMVTKRKDANGDCKKLDFPSPKKEINSDVDCEFINLLPDKSSAGAIQNPNETNKTDNYFLGILGVPDVGLLSPSQKDNLFTPGFTFPLEAIRPEPVKFMKYVNSESNPRAFSKIVIQTHSISVLIPVEIPPTPKCQLSLDSSVQQPLHLNSNTSVKFNVAVERGIASDIKLNLANHREASFNFDQFDRQSLKNFERMTLVKNDGFNMSILASDRLGIQNFTLSPDGTSRIWNVEATITGLKGTTQNCSTSIAIFEPPPEVTSTTQLGPPPTLPQYSLEAIAQPVNQATREGDSEKNYFTAPKFTFRARNSGGLPISYRWYRKDRASANWIEVPSSIPTRSESTLVLNSLRLLRDHGAQFKCKASNPQVGEIWSRVATLTISGGWVDADGGSCDAVCARGGFVPGDSPDGANCTSGETVPWSAWDSRSDNPYPIDYNWGCWDGCLAGKGCHTNRCREARWERAVEGKRWGYCYAPGQSRDNDNTDITVGCYCRPR